jgi:surfeit locus 1 family protein
MFARMFSRRWILATILVVCGMAVLARLGIWQLDRLAQRRAFNTRVEAQINQPVLDLNAGLKGATVTGADLPPMEYRQVVVVGGYDFSQQVALRNQVRDNQWGVDLITPLHIQGSDQTILVDRGWIPAADFQAGSWGKYDEPGVVTVRGVIRQSQSKPEIGQRSDPPLASGQTRLDAWNFVNVSRIGEQVSYPLLPVYIQQAPDPSWTGLPARSQPVLDLSEGPHQSYAIQWFSFALILGLGYPFFIRRQAVHQRKEEMKIAPPAATASRKP